MKIYSRGRSGRVWKDMMKIRGIIIRRRWMIGTREGEKEIGKKVENEKRMRVMEGSEE